MFPHIGSQDANISQQNNTTIETTLSGTAQTSQMVLIPTNLFIPVNQHQGMEAEIPIVSQPAELNNSKESQSFQFPFPFYAPLNYYFPFPVLNIPMGTGILSNQFMMGNCPDFLKQSGTNQDNSIIIDEQDQQDNISNPFQPIFIPFPCYSLPNNICNNGCTKNHIPSRSPDQLASNQNNIPCSLENKNPVVPETISPNNYYAYRKPQKKFEEKFDKSEDKHIQINIFKRNSDTPIGDPYIITKNGLMWSERNTNHDDIIIGRQKQVVLNQYTIQPCDISKIFMPQSDRSVSRLHCKIQTNEGFSFSGKLHEDFTLFLKVAQRRLPLQALKIIAEFSRKQPKFYLSDIGSSSGTYIKIRTDKARVIEDESIYLIGAETQFHICGMMVRSHVKPRNLEYFCESLSREVLRGAIIHGLGTQEMALFRSIQYISIGKEFQCQKKRVKTRKQFKLSNCDRPYLRVDVKSSLYDDLSTHVFIGKTNDDCLFKIGRSQDCDIVINLNTVSRKQALISYRFREQKWYILDGEDGRESANGTWESVQDFLSRQLSIKDESLRKLIEDKMEVRISDSILKFDFFNFNSTKKRKLNPAFCTEIIKQSFQ